MREQSMIALGVATALRVERARIRRDVQAHRPIALRRYRLADHLARRPDALRAALLVDVLAWPRRRGDWSRDVALCLRHAGCSEFKCVGELTDRQLGVLVAVLRSPGLLWETAP